MGYIRVILNLAFSPPDLVEAILDGRQPPAVTLSRLQEIELPAGWSAQREIISKLAF